MDALATWVEIALTAVVGLVGAYVAHGFRHQTKLRLAEARRSAYGELWEIMESAAPTRLDASGPGGGLSRDERGALFEALTAWYYRGGYGMLLQPASRAIFFGAKHNLTCLSDDLRPTRLLGFFPPEMTEEDRRGCLSIRQLSLLRTQLMSDLAIYGAPTVHALRRHERAFLTDECRLSLRRKPWRLGPRWRLWRSRTAAPPEETCRDSRPK